MFFFFVGQFFGQKRKTYLSCEKSVRIINFGVRVITRFKKPLFRNLNVQVFCFGYDVISVLAPNEKHKKPVALHLFRLVYSLLLLLMNLALQLGLLMWSNT